MRMLAILLSVLLLPAPAFAVTPEEAFQSFLKSIGPVVTESSVLSALFSKATTPCICRDPEQPELAGRSGAVMTQHVLNVGGAFFATSCAVPSFTNTGDVGGAVFCNPFDILK